VITLALVITVSILYFSVKRELRLIDADDKQFKQEFTRLFVMLGVFSLTYLTRWISDYWLVPNLALQSTSIACVIDGFLTFCTSYKFTQYYLLSSLFFDWLPLGLIVLFHFQSFRAT